MTPLDFVCARIADEEDADRRSFLASCGEDVDVEQATKAWERLGITAGLRINIALRQLGWSLCYTFGAFGLSHRVAKEAAKYADHPDYRPEWNS